MSITGITGSRGSMPIKLDQNLRAIKKEVSLPVCVGFGISTPEQARKVARSADGVIIGSSVVKALAAHPEISSDRFSKQVIRPFAKAMGKEI